MIRYICFFMMFFLSCVSSPKSVYPDCQDNFLIVDEKPALDSGFFNIIEGFISEFPRYCSPISIAPVCVTAEFLEEDYVSKVHTTNDTVLMLSFYNKYKDYKGYKGATTIKNYPVIILDFKNLGREYYDEEALIGFPLRRFYMLNFRIGGKYFKIIDKEWREIGGGIAN